MVNGEHVIFNVSSELTYNKTGEMILHIGLPPCSICGVCGRLEPEGRRGNSQIQRLFRPFVSELAKFAWYLNLKARSLMQIIQRELFVLLGTHSYRAVAVGSHSLLNRHPPTQQRQCGWVGAILRHPLMFHFLKVKDTSELWQFSDHFEPFRVVLGPRITPSDMVPQGGNSVSRLRYRDIKS